MRQLQSTIHPVSTCAMFKILVFQQLLHRICMLHLPDQTLQKGSEFSLLTASRLLLQAYLQGFLG
jgi:hypothetical protein